MPTALALGLALVALSAGLTLGAGGAAWPRRPALAALSVQMLAMPLLALGLGRAMQAPDAVVAGLVLVAAAPGLSLAQVLTALAGGDATIARSVTAPGILVAIVTLPAIADWLLPPTIGLGGPMLLLVLVPALAGLLLWRAAPALAARLDRPAAILASLATGLLMLAALWQAGPVAAALWSALGLALLSLGVARAVAAASGSRDGQAVALMMALPLRNVAVPIALAVGAGRPDWALAPACYGIVMHLPTLGLMVLRLRRARG